MDICEIHNCTMKQLMLSDEIMDNFEYQAWVSRWHECRFGSRWDHHMIAQLTGYVATIIKGGSFEVSKYLVKSQDDAPAEATELTEEEEMLLSYKIMCEMRGKEKADKWKANFYGSRNK